MHVNTECGEACVHIVQGWGGKVGSKENNADRLDHHGRAAYRD